MRRNLDILLAQRGYVTSYVTVPEQNLGHGVLLFQLNLGRISEIRVLLPAGAPRSAAPPAANALALRVGDVLNLRQVEQSLENLARLPSQAAQFRIEPGDRPGYSALVIAPGTAAGGLPARTWRFSSALDNAAAQEYGPWQGHIQAAWDAPLGWSDQLTASYTRNVKESGSAAQQWAYFVSYHLPWGRHALVLSTAHSSHARPIQGLSVRFSENGYDSNRQLRLQSVVRRSANSRWTLWVGHTQRRARNHVDDVELILQRRRINTADWGLDGWLRRADGDWTFAFEQSESKRVDAKTDFQIEAPPLARHRRLQLGWRQNFSPFSSLPAEWAPARTEAGPWQYEARWSWASVRHPATGGDLQSLGSRWSVRGYNGLAYISGREQFSVKQDLRAPAWALPSGLFAQASVALDYGRVAAATSGPVRELAGAALGLRLQGHGVAGVAGWAADLTAAQPLKRLHSPTGRPPAYYANLSLSY